MISMWLKLILLGLLIIVTGRSFAGPPFLTEDPVPTDYKHFELYLFTTSNVFFDKTEIEAPAVEIDYGLFPNFEINATIPIVTLLSNQDPQAIGLGDIEVGVVYRFLQETDFLPQISFSPTLSLPTGSTTRGLGNGRTSQVLPLSAQKSWGSWTTYGSGGYSINSAPDMKNHFFAGWLLQKDVSKTLTLGGEIFTQGASSNTISANTILNLGGYYAFTDNFSMLFSAGHSILGENNTVSYLGITCII